MSKMNYKTATTAAIKKRLVSNESAAVSQQSREEHLKMVEDAEFQKRANVQMNAIVRRFIAYKREELKLENYEDEEIEKIIENIINNETDDYYDCSSDEDDDSVYSDEESF